MKDILWHRLPRLVCAGALVAVSTTMGVAGSSLPASALTGCGTMTGSGTQADPWRLWTDADLDCVADGTVWVPGDGGAHGWAEIMADLVYDSSLPILPAHGFTYLHLDGRGHTVSIDGVTDTYGLISPTDHADIRNLVVVATNNSTLALGSGWLTQYDFLSTFTNVGSTGDISSSGGGIVGQATGTTINGAFSTGDIGFYAGGIVGSPSTGATVRRSVSTGSIANSAGGIVGYRNTGALVMDSFSTGYIGFSGGGILGALADGSTVVSSYSTGVIDKEAGGIVGKGSIDAIITNSYTLGPVNEEGGSFVGSEENGPTISNSIAFENSGWSDVEAMATLAGAGTTWLSCAVNEPWAIASFYPDDICSPVRDEVVVAEMAPTSVRRVDPSSGIFSLVNGVGTHPFSWVSIMNDTGSVRMNGVDCTTPTSCVVRGFTQAGAVAARDVSIVSAGRVNVLVHAVGEIGHRKVFDLDVGAVSNESPGSGPGGSGSQVLPSTGWSASGILAFAGLVSLLGVGLMATTRRRVVQCDAR